MQLRHASFRKKIGKEIILNHGIPPPQLRSIGFTLIEILITMVIAGIVVGVGTAGYRQFSKDQSQKAGIAQVINNLRFVQGRALAGEKPAACVNPNTLLGYEVSYIDTQTYRAKAVCSDMSSGPQTDYILPPGIQFAANFSTFKFLPVAAGADTGALLILKEQNSTLCYGVNISTSGDVADAGEVSCILPSPTPSPTSTPVPSSSPSPSTTPSPIPTPTPSPTPSPSPIR